MLAERGAVAWAGTSYCLLDDGLEGVDLAAQLQFHFINTQMTAEKFMQPALTLEQQPPKISPSITAVTSNNGLLSFATRRATASGAAPGRPFWQSEDASTSQAELAPIAFGGCFYYLTQ